MTETATKRSRWTAADQAALLAARQRLETFTLGMRLAHAFGTPVARALEQLPGMVALPVQALSQQALQAATRAAVRTLGQGQPRLTGDWSHRLAAGILGAAGGAVGLAALAVELPLSTTLMMRSSACIAQQQGEDLTAPATQLACVEIFALGGRSVRDDATEAGYFAVRAGLARALADTARVVVQAGVLEEGAPMVARLTGRLASRFGALVSEKVAAGAVPIVGAIGGAAVNALFMAHFQNVAHGHFTIRRLERRYGAEAVRGRYERIDQD